MCTDKCDLGSQILKSKLKHIIYKKQRFEHTNLSYLTCFLLFIWKVNHNWVFGSITFRDYLQFPYLVGSGSLEERKCMISNKNNCTNWTNIEIDLGVLNGHYHSDHLKVVFL